MAPRFNKSSFKFKKSEIVPEHIEDYSGSERDPSLWHVDGFDTFEGESYPLASDLVSLSDAELLAKAAKRLIEQLQPTETSGGSSLGGIQDRVHIIHPNVS